jgi:hypothetical protein
MSRRKVARPLPRVDERVLNGVLGIVDRSKHPIAMNEQLAPVRIDELGKGLGRSTERRLPSIGRRVRDHHQAGEAYALAADRSGPSSCTTISTLLTTSAGTYVDTITQLTPSEYANTS